MDVVKKITPEQIKIWKEKHAQIIRITSDDGNQEAYFKKPTLAVLQDYLNQKETDVFQALQGLFENCILQLDEDSYNYEDEFVLSAAKGIVKNIESEKPTGINKAHNKDVIRKTAALIRHYFNIDPYKLSTTEYYKLFDEVSWLEQHKKKQLESAMASVLAKVFTENYN